jgi:hypothetical protein
MVDKLCAYYASLNSEPIPEFFVFFSVDENSHGICATEFAGMLWPLVTGDADMVERMKPDAQRVAKITGKRIVLAKFSSREDIWSTETTH